jgi:hypothetical protein
MKTNITENPISVDPETGKVDYGVYHNVIKKFKDFLTYYRDTFLKSEQVIDKNDPKFNQIFEGSKYLYNQFISNLKKNLPREYKDIETIVSKQIKEIIKDKLKELSATGSGPGAATFTPGTGANYATPYAFNPNKKAKGAQNIYYYKLGWKPVPAEELHKQSKVIDHKDLWKKKLEETKEESKAYLNSLNIQDPSLNKFIGDKIGEFDTIEDKLNILLPLLQNAKKETMEYYKNSPEFQIKYGTDLAVDYLDDLITLFKNKQQ